MTEQRNKAPADDEPAGTRLESDDEIRQALEARRARLAGQPPAGAPGRPAPPPPGRLSPPPSVAEEEDDTQPDRPLLRPPMAMLCILDDGRSDGEWVRLRADRTVVGRSDGDVRVPHDGMMSGQHAAIVRQKIASGWRWLLMDLQSTNGSFVRIGSTQLRGGNELLVGTGRYRFEAANLVTPSADAAATQASTQAWTPGVVPSLVPSLVELSPHRPVQRYPLSLPEYWIGRHSTRCAIARPDDLLASPRHARLHRDARGVWHVENNRSLNGLWLRVEQLPLGLACQIRLGEQRFLFKVIA